MRFPRLKINLEKIRQNTEYLVNRCKHYGISVAGVTKSFGAAREVTQAMIDGGIEIIADSRIKNLYNHVDFNLPKMLLRIPMQSEIEDVIKYTDISLNSNIDTIRKLAAEAEKQSRPHKIVLMIDIGDLREGLWFESLPLIDEIVAQIVELDSIKLIGIGTNITCYGGVIATEYNMNLFIQLAERIENKYNLKFELISGGNSSSLFMLDRLPSRINNLRLGESIILGRETRFGKYIKNTHNDAFVLEAEIVEIYVKPSVPFGEICKNAFGEIPKFTDFGMIQHGVVALGRQDVLPENLIPIDKNIHIIGASSDHLIIDIDVNDVYYVGSIVAFRLTYGGVLGTITSKYVSKEFT